MFPQMPVASDNPSTESIIESAFSVSTRTRTSSSDGNFDNTAIPTASVPIEAVEDDNGVLQGGVKGGAILPVGGSGKMAVSPARVEKGSSNNTFTLTYTAATNLSRCLLNDSSAGGCYDRTK